MPRGVVTYIAVSLIASWGFGALAWYAQESFLKDKPQMAGFLFLPLIVVPIILVWVLHRQQASGGNPYAGAVWGPTGYYWLLYFGMLAYAAAILAVLVVLGAAGFDPKMSGYIQSMKDMMAAQGKPLPPQAAGSLGIGGIVTAIVAPVFGPWLGTAVACLTGFPLLGWLTRRLLVKGRGFAFGVLAVFYTVATASAGVMANPQLHDLSLPLRIGLYGLSALCGLPITLWLFYRTRSVVLAMLAWQTYASGQAGLMPFVTDSPMWLSAPQIGLAFSAGLLLLGIALWVWKDPGGQDLAVAAVAQDGTPLTPEMLRQAQEYAAQPAPATSAQPPL
jgi:hypothetical protein